VKNVRKWYKGIKTYFDNKKMYQILLKINNHTELTVEENKELDYWVFAYDHRHKLYKQLKTVIELQKELSAAKETEILNVSRRIKGIVPKVYINVQTGCGYDRMRSDLLFGLKTFGNEIALKLIRGKMQGAIFFLMLVLVAIGAFVFWIFRFS